jgi:hypothetical protein
MFIDEGLITDFRLLWWLTVNVNSGLECLCYVDVSNVANFWAKWRIGHQPALLPMILLKQKPLYPENHPPYILRP